MQKQDVRLGKLSLRNSNYVPTGLSLDEVLNRLSSLEKIDQTLKQLHVKKNFDVGELTDIEVKILNELVRGIYDKQPVSLSIDGKAGSGGVSIGNIRVLLNCRTNDEGSGFMLSNFFESMNLVLCGDDTPPSEGVPISPYVILQADEFESVDNIDFDEIVSSIRKFPYTEIYGAKITLFILELLKYYDSKETKNPNILVIVEQLLDFLQKNEKGNKELYQINYLQTAKRQRPLTKEEIQRLMSLKTVGIPLQFQLAACILLDSFYEAQILYEQLNAQERKEFDGYPICNIWTHHNGKT